MPGDSPTVALAASAVTRFLSRDEILNADDQAFEDVPVPRWGGTVRIRSMSASDRDRFEYEYLTALEEKRTPNVRALLVARCCVDPATGKRLFTDDDAQALAEKNGSAMDELYGVAQRINVISTEDIDALVKSSRSNPDSDSNSN